jgi:hypothetical protein
MLLITIIVVIVIVGFLLWAINRFIPMDAVVKNILYFVIILVLVLWILQVFGVLGSLGAVRVR